MITRGPWELAEATTTIPIRSATANRTVATVRYNPNDLDDARLIAAAPDLLAALKQAHDALSIAALDRDEQAAYARQSIRIAIAKAEGVS